MHDIDRTQMEMEWETGDYGGEYEYEGSPLAYGETYGDGFGEFYGEAEYETSPFSEVEEMDLAAELLEIYDEAELDQFLGSLIKKAARGVRRFARSRLGRALGGALKSVAKRALPMAGAALGSFIAPGVGTAIGGRLGSMAGRMFGLELEGLSPEDQEFEVARRFVRFAGEASRQAAMAPPTAPADEVVQAALQRAAQKYAPGLAAGTARGGRVKRGGGGRWVRRGRSIVVLDV